MLSFAKSMDAGHIIDALSRSQAVIQFDLTGTILQNSCDLGAAAGPGHGSGA